MKRSLKAFLAICCSILCLICTPTNALAASEYTDCNIANVEPRGLVVANGVDGSGVVMTTYITPKSNCNSFRVFGRADDGSTDHKVSVSITVDSTGSSVKYQTGIPINGAYSNYYSVSLVSGVKYRVEFISTESFSYQAGIYAYN